MASVTKIDRTGGAPGEFVYKINIVAADLTDNSEVDLGANIDAGIVVRDVYAYVNTAETTATTKTIDVGLLSSESGGDANGFLAGLSVASAGVVLPTLDSGGQTLGALLYIDESGAGGLEQENFSTDSVTAKSLSATFGDAGGANELDVDVYLVCFNPVIDG